MRKSIALRRELNQINLVLEPTAGMAQVALEEGDLPQAKTCVEEILNALQAGALPSIEQPLQIYLTCYQVLKASQDPRALATLDTAYHLLQAWAAKIEEEELRSSLLENVTANRAIIAACRGP